MPMPGSSARADVANGLGEGMPTSTLPGGAPCDCGAGGVPGMSSFLRRLNKRTLLAEDVRSPNTQAAPITTRSVATEHVNHGGNADDGDQEVERRQRAGQR